MHLKDLWQEHLSMTKLGLLYVVSFTDVIDLTQVYNVIVEVLVQTPCTYYADDYLSIAMVSLIILYYNIGLCVHACNGSVTCIGTYMHYNSSTHLSPMGVNCS